ncbi:cryptochrome/photolyase family protein [Vibrio sp. WJH972]
MTAVRMVLGDQLSTSISSLQGIDVKNDTIFLCEVREETQYVKHHKKKIAFIFSAMRHFAQELKNAGFKVRYIKLDDPLNSQNFCQEIERCINECKPERIIVTHPNEHRVLKDIETWEKRFFVPVEVRADDRFLCSPKEFSEWAKSKSQLRMEYFYRMMRKKYNILMNDDKPVGQQWNFDADNRKPPNVEINIPQTSTFKPDAITSDVLRLVAEHFGDHFGDLKPFQFAVTRKKALIVLDQFIKQRLPLFGDYQDAMIEGEPWMFHAHISFYLNIGLLIPIECVQAAEQAYIDGSVPLNAAEGFIRQIIGWREYVRGIYWLKMPDYANKNYLDANNNLPDFYWTADTKMNCLRQCVEETRRNAYAHHIQRLMVLGNFALIAGIEPKQVNEWFLIVYADAFEWVELPNVSGMILFADGGYLASKPYASGGSYINKMSNYCINCSYKVSVKNGEIACPFNYLYWDFLTRNREKLAQNHRLKMMYSTYDRMTEDKKIAISSDTIRFFSKLD